MGKRRRDRTHQQTFHSKEPSSSEMEDSANLPDPDVIAAEIVEDLQAALAQFAEIASDSENAVHTAHSQHRLKFNGRDQRCLARDRRKDSRAAATNYT